MINDIKYLQYMDQDTDPKLLPPEACVSKTNMRTHGLGRAGVNDPVYSPTVIQGINGEVLGWCQDVANKAIIFFVTNQGGHNIYRYSIENKNVEYIYGGSVLNFKSGTNIEADVVDGMLYWTDGYFQDFGIWGHNPPRKMNINKALNMGDLSVEDFYKYSLIDRDVLSVIKPPPVEPLVVYYGSDSNVKRNYLRGFLFQFRYQYVYDDGEESTWSPVSKVPLPHGESAINATYILDETVNNYIEIIYKTGISIVKLINFAYRVGNTGNWKKFKTVKMFNEDGSSTNPNGLSTDTIKFYGNEVTYGLDQQEVERLFHDVPIVAKKQRFVGGTNLVYANYYSGYGNTDVDIDAVADYSWVTMDFDKKNIDYDVYPLELETVDIQSAFFTLRIWDYDIKDWWKYSDGDKIFLRIMYFDYLNGIVQEKSKSYDVVGFPTYDSVFDQIKEILEYVGYTDEGNYYVIDCKNDETRLVEIETYVERDGVQHPLHYAVSGMDMPESYPNEMALPVLDITTLNLSESDVFIMYLEWWIPDPSPDGSNVSFTQTINYSEISGYNSILQSLKETINEKVGSEKAFTIGNLLIIKNDFYIVSEDDNIHGAGLIFSSISGDQEIKNTWKSGSSVEVGIVYYDSYGRSSGVQGIKTITFDTISQYAPSQLFTEYKLLRNGIRIRGITGNPPDWATGYQVVVSPKRKKFFQYIIDPPEKQSDGKFVRIYLNDSIQEGLLFNSKVNYGYYDFKQGDRVRFLYTIIEDSPYNNVMATMSTQLDFQIIDVKYRESTESYQSYEKDDDIGESQAYIYDENGNKVRKRTAEYLVVKYFETDTYFLTLRKSVIEVYTPEVQDDDNNPFYEIGERQSVDDGFHQLPGLIYGDVYIRGRIVGVQDVFICEDENYSDIYPSNVWDRGRPNVYIEKAESKWYHNYLKHSKKYIKDSTNGLSDFDSVSHVLNPKFGEITGLAEIGYVLKVNQEIKNTSIYIGRVVLNQSDGNQGVVGTTDNFIGTIMPSQFDYGTVFPKSIVTNGTHQYMFDVFNGAVIRDAYNGPHPISSYGMNSYFKRLSKDIMNVGIENVDVVGGWAGQYDEFILTFHFSNKSETIVFHEPSNKWSHFVTSATERYMWIGDTLLSFENNELKLEDQQVTDSIVTKMTIIANAVPIKNKIFKNIQIKAGAPFSGDVEILDDNGDVIMSSKILPTDWVKKQDTWWANFRRNNLGQSDMELITGVRLRGRLMRLTLEGSTGIAYAIINSITSEKS